jgi:hypothetical protein
MKIDEIKKGQKDSNGYSRCWPGKHAEGTKKGRNGGQVRNCVPNESVEEAANAAQQAAIAIAMKKKAGVTESLDAEIEAMYEAMDCVVTEMARANNISEDLVWETFEALDDHMLYETAAWHRKAGKNKNGGLNAKGMASYRREHPGSKLQTAVTTKPSKLKPGSKAAKRRKSFCARMSGVKGPMKKPNGKPTRKALSLRKWHC